MIRIKEFFKRFYRWVFKSRKLDCKSCCLTCEYYNDWCIEEPVVDYWAVKYRTFDCDDAKEYEVVSSKSKAEKVIRHLEEVHPDYIVWKEHLNDSKGQN